MTTPSVPDFIAGYAPQQSDFETLWTGPSTFFLDRVIARMQQQSSSTTLPDSEAVTKILFDTVLEDPYDGWSASNHWWEAPAGYSGWYHVTYTLGVTGITNDDVILVLQLETTSATYSNIIDMPCAGTSSASVAMYVYLVGGQDTVSAWAYVINATANVTTSETNGLYPSLEIVWVSS
jgi:hypothetical protein